MKTQTSLSLIVQREKFFATVHGPPNLRAIGDRTHRVEFFSWRSQFWGSSVFLGMAGVLVFAMARFSSPVMYLALLPIVLMLAVMGRVNWSLSKTRRCELRDGELWLGKPELESAGRVQEVRCVLLRERENPFWEGKSENWSSRVYLRVTGTNGATEWLPLFESTTTLIRFARRLAAAVELPVRDIKGVSGLPELETERRPVRIG